MLVAVFQVYPTATRALGLGSCSGMARVGALITPFIAQVGVAPKHRGVGMTRASAWQVVTIRRASAEPSVCIILCALSSYGEVLLADEKTEAQKG